MAKESFDTELQFLRMMLLTTGAYNRNQFSERLGISVHTFDKTLKKMKDILFTVAEVEEHKKDIYRPFRYSHYSEHPDHLFTFLFRAKSLKESEVTRLTVILTALSKKEHTLKEMFNAFQDEAQPDEKTLRQDLKYLEQLAIIKKTSETRPYSYCLDLDILETLTPTELVELYDFVDIMAHTKVPSVQGYMLRDVLKRKLTCISPEENIQVYSYKYHYVSRILDEYHLYTIMQAYNHRRSLTFLYHSPKKKKVFEAKNTNPLFEKETSGTKQHVIPVKVIYDHQYGRWYLMAQELKTQRLRKYRMDGISQLEENEVFEEATLRDAEQLVTKLIEKSWVIDTGRAIKVKLKFYFPVDTPNNFIQKRVELQGQWGTVVEEQEDGFVFEIEVNSTIEIKPWIRSFGSSCEVLEPRYFRQEFKKEWEVIQSYYEPL